MFIGAIGGVLMFMAVPVAVDCILYPDACINKAEEQIRYIKGNYTAVYNRFIDMYQANNIDQENVLNNTEGEKINEEL